MKQIKEVRVYVDQEVKMLRTGEVRNSSTNKSFSLKSNGKKKKNITNIEIVTLSL